MTHLGFYLMTASLKPYRLLAAALREAGFGGVILAGGVHPTLCPEESLADGADFAVQGPGELPLRMILEGGDPASIPGLVWRRAGVVRVNPQSLAQKVDLDALPFPIFRFGSDLVLLKGRLRPLTRKIHREHADWHGKYYDLVTSRGCPYRCTYCCNVNRGAIRRASVDHVIQELRHLRERVPDIAGVNIQDDAFFSGSEEWVEEFCRRYRGEVRLPFIIRMIPRFVTPKRLELFKAAGLGYVTMGLEGSDRLNRDLFKRREDRKSFLKAARAVLEAGLYLSVDVLVDNPYETEDDLREVAQTLNSLPRPNWGVVALSLTPFPNTAFYEQCARDGMLERFATDAYDSMLMPSREGGYLTPRFWHLLNTQLIPHISPHLASKLIEAGPEDPQAARTVERLAAWFRRVRGVTGWFRDHAPRLYRLAARCMTRLGRGSTHAAQMTLPE